MRVWSTSLDRPIWASALVSSMAGNGSSSDFDLRASDDKVVVRVM